MQKSFLDGDNLTLVLEDDDVMRATQLYAKNVQQNSRLRYTHGYTGKKELFKLVGYIPGDVYMNRPELIQDGKEAVKYLKKNNLYMTWGKKYA